MATFYNRGEWQSGSLAGEVAQKNPEEWLSHTGTVAHFRPYYPIGAHYAQRYVGTYMFWVCMGLALIAIFAVPPIMYHFYEKPCLNLREHISPLKIKEFFLIIKEGFLKLNKDNIHH
jgi:hypothetical protein